MRAERRSAALAGSCIIGRATSSSTRTARRAWGGNSSDATDACGMEFPERQPYLYTSQFNIQGRLDP
jgi:hypothetical protein